LENGAMSTMTAPATTSAAPRNGTMAVPEISLEAASYLVQKQRAYFEIGATRSIDQRKQQLRALYDAIKAHKDEILQALHTDFRKPAFEGYLTEVGFVMEEIHYQASFGVGEAKACICAACSTARNSARPLDSFWRYAGY
jgi:acyl-CoA reductase-like NAD-dependent aldehyde dehydrogenase